MTNVPGIDGDEVGAPRSMDVIIPTCDRPALLRACLESIDLAAVSTSMRVRALVVDNGARSAASDVLRAFRPRAIDVLALREPVSGKSRALNRALRELQADLVGFVDDDEALETDWFEVAEREFLDPAIGFIGGPYIPQFESPPPSWLPAGYPAVIGATDSLTDRVRYRADAGPVLMGGNAIVHAALQRRAGEFDVSLGPSAEQRQRTGEDHDMFLRYLQHGAVGYFVPQLRIRHHVPSDRLHKDYFRTFVRAHGRAQAALDHRRPQSVARILGVPRYRVGDGVRAVRLLGAVDASLRFQAELQVRECVAFVAEHLRLRGSSGTDGQ